MSNVTVTDPDMLPAARADAQTLLFWVEPLRVMLLKNGAVVLKLLETMEFHILVLLNRLELILELIQSQNKKCLT